MSAFYSIVIPVYNVENYLEACVRSVTDQIGAETPPVEIVLVDDGSTDRSGELCEEIAREAGKENPRDGEKNAQDREMGKNFSVKVVHQQNRGLLSARRAGYRVTSGEYILYLDSDDLLTEDALAKITAAIRETNADVVFYNLSMMEGDQIRPYYRNVFTGDGGCQLSRDQVLESYYTADIPAVTSMCGKAFRRSCIDLERDYAEYGRLSMGEDTLQSAEVISRAESFTYLNENLYLYRMGSGMTARFDPDYYPVFRKIMEGVGTIPRMVETEKARAWYREKILSSGCRAITQSKGFIMTLEERKKLVQSVFQDELFRKALGETSVLRSSLKGKYKGMILLAQVQAYGLLHRMLSPRGTGGAA